MGNSLLRESITAGKAEKPVVENNLNCQFLKIADCTAYHMYKEWKRAMPPGMQFDQFRRRDTGRRIRGRVVVHHTEVVNPAERERLG